MKVLLNGMTGDDIGQKYGEKFRRKIKSEEKYIKLSNIGRKHSLIKRGDFWNLNKERAKAFWADFEKVCKEIGV